MLYIYIYNIYIYIYKYTYNYIYLYIHLYINSAFMFSLSVAGRRFGLTVSQLRAGQPMSTATCPFFVQIRRAQFPARSSLALFTVREYARHQRSDATKNKRCQVTAIRKSGSTAPKKKESLPCVYRHTIECTFSLRGLSGLFEHVHINMYIYTHIYIYMYVCMYVYTYINIYLHIYIYIQGTPYIVFLHTIQSALSRRCLRSGLDIYI